MRKNRWLLSLVIFVVLCGLLSVTGCKRAGVDDPETIGPAGFRIILSGTAHPSTVLVKKDTVVYSVITASVKNNDGTPVVNGAVIFSVPSPGYIDPTNTNKVQATLLTNSNGEATINYYLPPLNNLFSPGMVYIYIQLVDDGRLDDFPLGGVFDIIPVQLFPDEYPVIAVVPDTLTFQADSIWESKTVLVKSTGTNDILHWGLADNQSFTWISVSPTGGTTGSTFIVSIQESNNTGVERKQYVVIQAYDLNDSTLPGVTATLTVIQKKD